MKKSLFHILTWLLLIIPIIIIEILSKKYNISLSYYLLCFIAGWNTTYVRKLIFKQ